jgi:hypothetical protein
VAIPLLIFSIGAAGQELTPRSFWPAPHGTKILGLGYSYSTGDIVTDPSLPVSGVDSKINTGAAIYQQTLDLAGRSTNVQLELPYVFGTTSGELLGESARANYSGFGDLAATLSINILGAPTLTPAAFQALRLNPRPIVAASIRVVAPTGEYDPDKLINLGTNRWAVKAKLGYVQPLPHKTMLELGAGVWFFQDNRDFLGLTRQQDPIGAFDASLIKRFKPGFWASLDASYYIGGRTTVDGIGRADFQRNFRAGISVAYPIRGRHAIKLGYSTGVVTETGGDYDNFLLSYFYRLQ